MKTLADSDLFRLVATDPGLRQSAFAELYRRNSQRVFAYCRRFLGDPAWADDVFQETFIRFYNAALDGRDVVNVPAYLLRIARNLCFNAKRDRPNTVPGVEEMEIPYDDTVDEQHELAELLVLALDLLPTEQKEALLLQMYGDLSYQQISAELGVPLTTVRNWIARGKRRLREILVKRLEEQRR